MATPTYKLVFDRHNRATPSTEGTIELRITYNRIQRYISTGVRVLPKHWRNGTIVHCMDATERQRTLDTFVINVKKIVNNLIESGQLDMDNLVKTINEQTAQSYQRDTKPEQSFIEFCRHRAEIRKFGRSADSCERYDRFIRWLDNWGQMQTFKDVDEHHIMLMDDALTKTNMKDCSKWNNYHRFLNSFILDAMEDGLMSRNPYARLHINKDKVSHGIDKYLTTAEFDAIARLWLPNAYLNHARDLFMFQTYTCLSYVDMVAFDSSRLRQVNGHTLYTGTRGKTKQEFTFLLLDQAKSILDKYNGRLPIMSNQKYNDRLKILASMASINKPLSSHWARHTGATMLLNSGVPMEIVARVLGHASTKMTREIYAKLLDSTIAEAMQTINK